MPRIRTIKPEFWESETIASLSRDARLLFICCFNQADDEGRLRWNPAFLKSSAFMYDDDILTDSITSMMEELVTAELIFPYKGGKLQTDFAWIVSFNEHQRINRPTKSKLPAPPLPSDERPCKSRAPEVTETLSESFTEQLTESLTAGKERKGKEQGKHTDQTCVRSVCDHENSKGLFGDPPEPGVDPGDPGGDPSAGQSIEPVHLDPPGETEAPSSTSGRGKKKYSPEFESFWKTITRHYATVGASAGAKSRALKAFKSLLGSRRDVTVEGLIAALIRQVDRKRELQQRGEFAEKFPHVCNWLSHERFEDELPEVVSTSSSVTSIEKARQAAQAKTNQLQLKSQKAWDVVLASIRQGQAVPKTKNPTILAVLERVGGYDRLKEFGTYDLIRVEGQFRQLFENRLQRGEDDQRRCAQ